MRVCLWGVILGVALPGFPPCFLLVLLVSLVLFVFVLP